MFLRLAGTEYDGLFLFSSAVLGNHQRRARADGGRHAEGERAPRCQGTAARTHQCLLQVRRLPDTSFWFPSIPFLLLNITIFLFLSVLRYFLLSVYPSIYLIFLFICGSLFSSLSFSYLSFSLDVNYNENNLLVVLLPSTSFSSYHCYCISRFLSLAITIYLFLSVFLFLSGCLL